MSSQARVKFESDMEEIAECISVVNTFVHVGEKTARHDNARRTRTAPESILTNIAEAASSKNSEEFGKLPNHSSESTATHPDERTTIESMDDHYSDHRLDLPSPTLQDDNSCHNMSQPMLMVRTSDGFEGVRVCPGMKMFDALHPEPFALQEVTLADVSLSLAARTSGQLVAEPATLMQMPAPSTSPSMFVPSSASPKSNPRPVLESEPRLLGRTSLNTHQARKCVGDQGLDKVQVMQMIQRNTELAQPTVSTVLKCVFTSNGKETVSWNVDGRKLESLYKHMLSPEFDLQFEGIGAMPFRLMILAKETKGKGGSFQKAGGQGCVFVKCETSLPSEAPHVAIRVTVRGRSGNVTKGPFSHQFMAQNCCPLQSDGEAWDLLPMVDQSSKRFEVCIEVL
eukprot:TRINITY_DN18023_c0_g1_i1.p1 TRINITY_DN18023_c0_g1~~TRINITY_DN18023_c0_g1_i1.p1  ORF type:complete len:397 (-),score=55.61 TRINITY_DN18023_c0_g1_i1:324-1514(-)